MREYPLSVRELPSAQALVPARDLRPREPTYLAQLSRDDLGLIPQEQCSAISPLQAAAVYRRQMSLTFPLGRVLRSGVRL